MNKANLKNYAPKARLDFIKAATERANVLGISATGAVPAQLRGDVAIIDGREWPAKVAAQRDELIARIKRHGFEQTMDEVAYTWFNRFAALRYMEIHDYLGHGWRVLSSRDGGLPEILRHASEVALPGLNGDRAREMQLAGNQDNELYKLLLVAQCNDLSRVMPFLFERIDDETELLLPENLLRTDSIVAKLVESVPEEDWQEIEVIGWLYQFYISEKKDQVMGKVVKSEDIPAATQLFTPNWIVQYLAQNSLGRLWLMANPTSTLASQWPYYIQPAEQAPEVQAQLDALIQTRIREDGETLNPETITVLDPACGSGHILVVAYDVLKSIYLERGYQVRAVPRLILEKNLYGLDIDERASQLAAFALLMKARADDRRLFSEPIKLNVASLQDGKGLDLDELAGSLVPFGIQRAPLGALLDTFEHVKTFGSLIQVQGLAGQLAAMNDRLQQALRDGDLYARQAAKDLLPLVWQGLVLDKQFDTVIANPPYMGGSGMNPALKAYAKTAYPNAKADLFAMFIERGFSFCKHAAFNSMVTMQSWMFLSAFEGLRASIVNTKTISTFVQIGFNSFPEINSKIAQACMFSMLNAKLSNSRGQFVDLNNGVPQSADKGALLLSGGASRYSRLQKTFLAVTGSPLCFWLAEKFYESFQSFPLASKYITARIGMATGNNSTYVRFWHEVDFGKLGIGLSRQVAKESQKKWFPYAKGGPFRRWYGNRDSVVNWQHDGQALQTTLHPSGDRVWAHNFNLNEIFRGSICWTVVTSSAPSFRLYESGFIFDAAAGLLQPKSRSVDEFSTLGFLNSKVAEYFLNAIKEVAPQN